jgi:hypothetical protein
MKIRYVYGLVDPFDKKIFYIGKTDNTELRLKAHINSCTKTDSAKNRHIVEILSKGKKPHMEILASTDLGNINDLEKQYINEYAEKYGTYLKNHNMHTKSRASIIDELHFYKTKYKEMVKTYNEMATKANETIKKCCR